MRGENFKTVGDFTVAAGEEVPFVLVLSRARIRRCPSRSMCRSACATTEKFWTAWAGRNKIQGPWDEAVTRSLIMLKSLTYAPTGGMAAAPTTSLPEFIGGPRNWDYRFCWLRDATLTLLALMNAGYYDEAQMWRDWLLRAAAGSPRQIQIMYGLRGERRLTEWEVPWLPGYENSQPVRIGNAAHNQLQLDIFGEVMDALHQARQGGLGANEAGWAMQREFLAASGEDLARAGRRHLGSAQRAASISPIPRRWPGSPSTAPSRARKCSSCRARSSTGARLRERIHARRLRSAASMPSSAASCAAYGSKELDASLLLLPAIGFLPPHDPRIVGTVAAIERRLMVDGLVLPLRHARRADDGLPAGEGVFLACSFWLADAYLMLGRRDDALRLFERLLVAAQRRRAAERGIRPAHAAAGRQFSAGLFASRAGQYREQPRELPEARRTEALGLTVPSSLIARADEVIE